MSRLWLSGLPHEISYQDWEHHSASQPTPAPGTPCPGILASVISRSSRSLLTRSGLDPRPGTNISILRRARLIATYSSHRALPRASEGRVMAIQEWLPTRGEGRAEARL